MEKGIEEMPVKTLINDREEILKGMITSFHLEGIEIREEIAYTILERVERELKTRKQ